MPEISVIVPVYKVEQYLDRCVKSILNQTFTDFELILVDDGSPDRCPQMCDEWAEKDKRIRVIHKENGGLSSARNAGIEVAQGRYIGFVDSDDWIAYDMYQILHELIVKHEADYAAVEMTIAKTEGTDYEQMEYTEKILTDSELFKMFFRVLDENIHYCVCDKLYRADIVKTEKFLIGKRFEDIDFNFKILKHCRKAVYTNLIKYFWFYNEGSITRNALVSEDLQLIGIWENIVEQCEESYRQYKYYAQMNYERAFLGILGKYVKFGVSSNYVEWTRDQRYLIKNLRKYALDLLKWRMPLSRKVLLLMLCVNHKLTANIYRWRR